MATHGRLSDAAINKLRPGETLRDTEVRGLSVRRNLGDSATYYLIQRAHTGANPTQVKLGRWSRGPNGLSPTDARAIANKRKAAKTLHEVDGHFRFPRLRDFIKDVYYPNLDKRMRVPPKQKTHLAGATGDAYRKILNGYVLNAAVNRWKIGDMRLDQIDRDALLGLHTSVIEGKERAREATADQAVTVLVAALGHAEVVYARQNYRRPPMRDFPFLKRGYCREVYANPDEMDAFRKELNRRLTGTRPMARPGPKPRGEHNDLLLIAALWVTGHRSGALRLLRWDQLKLAAGGDEVFVIPPQDGIKKKRGDTVVPVTPELRSIIDSVKRFPSSPWVFSRPADTDGVYRVPPLNRILYDAIKNMAGCEHLRPHDVRRSVGTLARELGDVSRDDVRDTLGHANAKTTDIYTPARPTLPRAARRIASVIGHFIPAAPAPAVPTNVVRMKKRLA